jgi:patatin-like phospholipase/acyl hydrolase
MIDPDKPYFQNNSSCLSSQHSITQLGNALNAIFEAMQEMSKEKGMDHELIHKFDLFAGTSVGGCASLTFSIMDNT